MQINALRLTRNTLAYTIFFLAFVVAIAADVFIFYKIKITHNHAKSIEHSHQVMKVIAAIMLDISEAQKNHLDDIRRNETTDLIAQKPEITKTANDLIRLKKLIADNNGQTANLKKLDLLFADLRQSSQSSQSSQSNKIMLLTEYQVSSLDMMTTLIAIDQYESTQQAQRIISQDSAYNSYVYTIYFSKILSICILIISFIIVKLSLHENEKQLENIIEQDGQLKEAASNSRSLIEASLDALVSIDVKGKISDVNRATELITGISRDKLINTDFSDYFTDKVLANKVYELAFTTGSLRDYPLTIKSTSGVITDVLYNASVYKDNQGNIMGVFAAARDISKLTKSLKDLEQSNKDLQQFVYIVSHDLQEPLRMISSFLQLIEIRYKDKLDKDANEFINYAVGGAKRLHDMIISLLLFSRVQSQGQEFVPVNAETVLLGVVKDLKVPIDASKATITHDCLPTVNADGPQLALVFQNLISNSIKFRSQESPKIHISADRHDNAWRFSVRDNGTGIDQKHQESLFVLFKRLVGQEIPGTGVGLAVCKRIVERHNGRIWADSALGKGATFYFTIPDDIAALTQK